VAVTEDVRPIVVTVPAVRESERGLASLVDVLDPDAVALADAANLWKAFDSVERLAASAKVLLAARVEAAGAWKHAGARSAAEHLARLGGTTTSAARRSLEVSRQVADLPRITDALRGGVLSAVQVDAIASAAAADPSAENRLLCTASTTNVTELREECLRTKAAADPDRDATHRRIHANRCYRTYADAEVPGISWRAVPRSVGPGSRLRWSRSWTRCSPSPAPRGDANGVRRTRSMP
jgi:hypothetical protein